MLAGPNASRLEYNPPRNPDIEALKKGLRPSNHSLLGHTTIITAVVFSTTQTLGPPPDHPHSARLELTCAPTISSLQYTAYAAHCYHARRNFPKQLKHKMCRPLYHTLICGKHDVFIPWALPGIREGAASLYNQHQSYPMPPTELSPQV